MMFIADVGFFVSERRYFNDFEYSLTTPPVPKEKADNCIKVIKDFVESLPWEDENGIIQRLSDEHKSTYTVRLYKQKARRMYANFLIEPAAKIRDYVQGVGTNLDHLRAKFGKTSDEVHEVFSFSCELNKYCEFNFGNQHILMREDFRQHVKEKFGDQSKIENIEAQIFYLQREIRFFMTRFKWLEASSIQPNLIMLLKEKIKKQQGDEAAVNYTNFRLVMSL